MKRKVVSLLLAVVLVCTVTAAMLVGCGNDEKKPDPQPETKATATSYVALDINPAVELILDENNVVMSATGQNEDAKVLLHGEDGIVGADVNAAVEKIGKLSADLKYINNDNQTVNITVGSSLETAAGNKLQADVVASINKGSGIELSIKTDGNFSLQREIDAFKAQYPDNQAIQNIDIAQYRVMMQAMAADVTLKAEEAVKMSMGDLLERVEDAREDALEATIDALPKAQKAALEVAEAVYEATVERLETGVYMKAANPGVLAPSFKDHVAYIAYKNIDITLDQIEALVEKAQAEIGEEVKAADVDAIFAKLVEEGVLTEEQAAAEKAKVVDAEGKADLDKIEERLDIILKNAKEDVADKAEEALDDVLDRIEDDIEALEDEIPETIREDIKKLIDDVAVEINNELKDMGIDLGKASTIVENIVNEAFNAYMDGAKNYTVKSFERLSDYVEAKLEGGEYEKFDVIAGEYKDVEIKEEDSLEAKVLASMSDEEKAEAEQLKDDLKNGNTKIAEAKRIFDEAVEKAVAEANEYLTAQKAERKAA